MQAGIKWSSLLPKHSKGRKKPPPTFVHFLDSSMLSSKPCLFFHKLSILRYLVECKMIWLRFQYSNEHNLLHFIEAGTSHHQQMFAMTYFKSSVWKELVFCSAAMLQLMRKTWQPMFTFLMWNVLRFWLAETLGIWLIRALYCCWSWFS